MNISLDTLENVLLALLVADALALAVLVLIQQGKGADAGAAFGAGGAGTVFGSAGSTSFLVKMTSWLAIGFFLIAFGLAYTAKERAGTLSELGIPQVTAPLSGLDDPVLDAPVLDTPDMDEVIDDAIDDAIDLEAMDDLSEEIDTSVLTDPVESVDSDIPDV